MSEYKIEKGIPLPVRHNHKGYVDALLRLQGGDSVLLPTKISNISSLAYHIRKKNPSLRFVTRTVDGGTRVWRIE
jgi:hypothetical protein